MRDSALLALAARAEDVTADAYRAAVDAGDVVVAYVVRGAIHALAPGDFGLYGRALIADDDAELGAQLGRQVRRLAAEKGFTPTAALAEVATAVEDALSGNRALDKNELHEELRKRVSPDVMPWCKGCQSHHVAPMLWRYATVRAGVRLDSGRRYLLDPPSAADPSEAVRRFLRFYGPATPAGFADWAGVARPHAQRLWDAIAADVAPVEKAWVLAEDADAVESPPAAHGVRLLPPGDPYLQPPNRALLAPDAELRKRLFRPVASRGAVLSDGRLAGLWRARAKGKKLEVAVESLDDPPPRGALDEEAQRVARLRGASAAVLA